MATSNHTLRVVQTGRGKLTRISSAIEDLCADHDELLLSYIEDTVLAALRRGTTRRRIRLSHERAR